MTSKVKGFFIFVLCIIIMLYTNPDKKSHVDKIKESYAKDVVGEKDNNLISDVGREIIKTISGAQLLIDGFKVKNYRIFSIGYVKNKKGDNNILSIGIINLVILTKDLSEIEIFPEK